MKSAIFCLRWIGFLPMAAASYIVAWTVMRPINYFFNYSPLLPYTMEWEGTIFDRFWIEYLPNMASGCILIIVGSIIVPTRSGIVAISLVVLASAVSGISIGIMLTGLYHGDQIAVISAAIGTLIGSVLTTIHIIRKIGIEDRLTIEQLKSWF